MKTINELEIGVFAVRKGDVPGHAFHGNQHTGGGSGEAPEAGKANTKSVEALHATTKAEHSGSKADHQRAFNMHAVAATLHGTTARQYDEMGNKEAAEGHRKVGLEHMAAMARHYDAGGLK